MDEIFNAIYRGLEWFNTVIAGPLGFLATIITYHFAKATTDKLQETKEISRLMLESEEYYLGTLEAIKITIDSTDDLEKIIPNPIKTELYKFVVDFKNCYPTITKKNKTFKKPIKKLYKLSKAKTSTHFAEIVEPFNIVYNALVERRDIV